MSNMDIIRKELESHIGKRVVLKADKGRKRIVTKQGIIESVFPSLFVIELTGKEHTGQKITYTYSDVLTETVKLTIYDDGVEMPKKKKKIS
ncbi:MAG: Veg family protein [Tissierellia bacterium]|nr:Veg family protein [Tissierellia bacterium]